MLLFLDMTIINRPLPFELGPYRTTNLVLIFWLMVCCWKLSPSANSHQLVPNKTPIGWSVSSLFCLKLEIMLLKSFYWTHLFEFMSRVSKHPSQGKAMAYLLQTFLAEHLRGKQILMLWYCWTLLGYQLRALAYNSCCWLKQEEDLVSCINMQCHLSMVLQFQDWEI